MVAQGEGVVADGERYKILASSSSLPVIGSQQAIRSRMAATDSTVTDLISRLQHLQVKNSQPFCWLIKTSLAPWSANQCATERERFLTALLANFSSALWCSYALKGSNQTEVAWQPKREEVPTLVAENSHFGDWILLLFANEVGHTCEATSGVDTGLRNCDDAAKLCESTGADLLIYSLPDDIEWLITQRH